MNRATTLAVVLLISAGCGHDQGDGKAHAPSEDAGEYLDFFVGWLKRHGEKEIISSRDGVSVSGRPIRFSARTHRVLETKGGWCAELEFRTVLPDKRVILDYVAGMGADTGAAKVDALTSFTISTFHVLYSAFINERDPHIEPELHDMGGRSRAFHIGDWMVRSKTPFESETTDRLTRYVVDRIRETDLDETPHWIEVVYGQNQGKVLECATTLDNGTDPRLRSAVAGAPWPKRHEFYMLKLFVVVK